MRLGLLILLCFPAASPAAEPAQFSLFPACLPGPTSVPTPSLGLDSGPGATGCRLGDPGADREDRFALDLSGAFRDALPEAEAEAEAGVAPPISAPRRPLLSGRTLGLTLGVLGTIPIVGELVWWKGNQRGSFHFTDEGWFGRDTYAGGADKASHFFFGYMAGRELAGAYEDFGNTPKQSRLLSIAVVALGGALVELGDGFTDVYGYAWGDVASNFAGALAAVGIEAAGAGDLVGLRFGFVSARIPPPPNRAYGYGHDYSEDVYSADFKLAGALRRLHARPGPARFLLVSLTYGSKGYRFSPVDVRERNVGVDLGLNMPEILQALGVSRTKWWGRILLTFFEYVRVPYTAYGYQYDLNHHRWHGPSTGDKFDPGKVIYP